jgi:hypothetical protein
MRLLEWFFDRVRRPQRQGRRVERADLTVSSEIPIGRWLRIDFPMCRSFVGYTYVDSAAGLSVKGGSPDETDVAEAPTLTIRMPHPWAQWRLMNAEESAQLHLPDSPSWLTFYGPQPSPGTTWRG